MSEHNESTEEKKDRKKTEKDENTVLKEWAKKIMKEAKRRESMMG